jgi:hypothetical protein
MVPNITTSVALREFFYKKIKEALMLNQTEVSQEVEFYLVNILSHFSKTENYFHKGSDGKLEQRPLALKLYDAVFSENVEQFEHLKSLGDTALYHAGVFSDGLVNNMVDVDYYIGMGGNAYLSLASMVTAPYQEHISDMYHALGNQFGDLVDVLGLCCEKETPLTDGDLLKVLDKYLKTGSERAKNILKEKGIIPDSFINQKPMQ